MPGARFARIRAMIDQCNFSTHLLATWTGNHRNASVIFSYNPRISPAPRARTGVTRSYLLCALVVYNDMKNCACPKKLSVHRISIVHCTAVSHTFASCCTVAFRFPLSSSSALCCLSSDSILPTAFALSSRSFLKSSA